MTTYRTGNHWGVTIVREGEASCPASMAGSCVSMKEGFAVCAEDECVHHESGRRGAQLVAVVVNGDQALAERICELLNGGESGGPRSLLGDLIVRDGPYVAGVVRPAWLEAGMTAAQMNELRAELIALRDIATGGGA